MVDRLSDARDLLRMKCLLRLRLHINGGIKERGLHSSAYSIVNISETDKPWVPQAHLS